MHPICQTGLTGNGQVTARYNKAAYLNLWIQNPQLNVSYGSIDPRPFHQDRRYRLMASDRKAVEFLVEQRAGGGTVSAKAMFGEFGIYCDGKMVALVCDDHLFVKPTGGGRAFAAGSEEAPPYPGAKPCLLIDAEKWDDREWLAEIVRITSQELPAPKVRTKRKSG